MSRKRKITKHQLAQREAVERELGSAPPPALDRGVYRLLPPYGGALSNTRGCL